MATKKKAKTPKKKGAARKKGGKRSGLIALITLLVLMVGVVAILVMFKPAALKPVTGDVLLTAGEQGKGPGQVDGPRGLAVAPDGSVYLTDMGNHRVVKFAADGRGVAAFGKKGSGPADFNEPSGVAVDSKGRVLVADAWNGRVQILDANGKKIGEIAGKDNNFYSPRNVAVDRNDNIYVADTGNSRIQIFSSEGTRLKVIGERGRGKGRFDEIFGIAVNSKGEIFAADPGNAKIHKFSPLPDPKPLGDVKVPGWQRGRPFWPHLAVDAQDRVWAVDGANRQMWVYDSALKYLGTLGAVPGREILANPMGAAFGPDGNLYVSDLVKQGWMKIGNLRVGAK